MFTFAICKGCADVKVEPVQHHLKSILAAIQTWQPVYSRCRPNGWLRRAYPRVSVSVIAVGGVKMYFALLTNPYPYLGTMDPVFAVKRTG